MTSTPTGPDVVLPSSRTLLRSTAIAAAVAALILVTVVLPAEYGVDPTGVGNALGLKQMGEIKQQLAREAAAEVVATPPSADGIASPAETAAIPAPGATSAANAVTSPSAATAVPAATRRTDETRLTLAPNQGREIKLAMRQGARVTFRWATDRGVVNYDTHADRTAAPAIKYHGYAKGQGVAADSGVLVAAFDGMHGWFWRNRTRAPLTVLLTTRGDYQEIREVK